MEDPKTNPAVPPGISGGKPKYNIEKQSLEIVANELALLSLGDCEPLTWKIDTWRFMEEIRKFDNDWVNYLPRTDRVNSRKALALTNMPGLTHRDNPSHGQACYAAGRYVNEAEFCVPTEVYHACPSLHELLNTFTPLGRTFLVKCGTGGYFVPHRDHPASPRDSLRLIVFLNNCDTYEYDWIFGADNKIPIEAGRVYYANTKKTHRTVSWVDDSIHLIINVPFTSENVSKVIAHLKHPH
jgi:hypothetical protein